MKKCGSSLLCYRHVNWGQVQSVNQWHRLNYSRGASHTRVRACRQTRTHADMYTYTQLIREYMSEILFSHPCISPPWPTCFLCYCLYFIFLDKIGKGKLRLGKCSMGAKVPPTPTALHRSASAPSHGADTSKDPVGSRALGGCDFL